MSWLRKLVVCIAAWGIAADSAALWVLAGDFAHHFDVLNCHPGEGGDLVKVSTLASVANEPQSTRFHPVARAGSSRNLDSRLRGNDDKEVDSSASLRGNDDVAIDNCAANAELPSNLDLSPNASFAETLDPTDCELIQPAQAQQIPTAKRYRITNTETSPNSNLPMRSWPQITDALNTQPETILIYVQGFDDFIQQQQCQRQIKSKRVKIVRGGLVNATNQTQPKPISVNNAALHANQNAWLIGSANDPILHQLKTQYANIALIKSTNDLTQFGDANLFISGDFNWPQAIPSNWFHIQASSEALAAELAQTKTLLSDIGKPLKRPCHLQ